MTVLKRIPKVLSPRLLHILASMGHGDEIVLADANFPAASIASHTPGGLVNADGNDVPTLLDAIMQLLPLDETAPPAMVMGMMPEHIAAGWKTPIWEQYKTILAQAEGRGIALEEVERFAFYARSKQAYAVVATGETALYGNLILKKGAIGTSK